MDLLPSLRSADKQGDPVKVGRTVAVIAMVLAMLTAEPLLGKFDQAFQYIQEFTGFFTPGIVVIFLLGMFWKKTTAAGALAAAVGSVALSFLFKMVWPELPFIDRVGLVFLIAAGLAIIVSLIENRVQQGAIELSEIEFGTTQGFNLSALAVTLILAALYATWL